MAEAKWYQTGEAGEKRAKQIDKETKARREQSRGPRRFWLESDTAAKVTFLDTPKFFFHEHNLKLEGRFFNFFTCIKDMDTCPICESGDRSSYVVAGTVLNHKEWEDGDGKKHKLQKQLFVAKGRARQKLLRQIEKRDDDLTFCVYEHARGSSPTEANTGEDVEFMKRLKKSQVKGLIPQSVLGEDETTAEYMKPFNYGEQFAPLTAKQLRDIVGGDAPVGSEEEETEEEETEEEETEEAAEEVADIDDLV